MNMLSNSKETVRHRGAILGVMIITIIVIEAPKYLVFLSGSRSCILACVVLSQLLMIAFPYILARIYPTIAHFDNKWFFTARSQWLWFLGMALLLLTGGTIAKCLLSFHKDWFLVSIISPIVTDVKPTMVVLRGVILVIITPIAEEIFWRGYILEQLRKLTYTWMALLIHSFLFAFAHVFSFWLLYPTFFLYGMILGSWRIKFRCLLPLVIAHTILNGVALISNLKIQYDTAMRAYPKCKEIDLLIREPAEKAVPALIGFIGYPDEVVSSYAIMVLEKNYRSEAEPYLKEVLKSNDKRTIDKALFIVERFGYLDLKAQVRKIAWSFNDRKIQLAATLALHGIQDEEGLQDIAQRHPDEKVRQAAEYLIKECR